MHLFVAEYGFTGINIGNACCKTNIDYILAIQHISDQ